MNQKIEILISSKNEDKALEADFIFEQTNFKCSAATSKKINIEKLSFSLQINADDFKNHQYLLHAKTMHGSFRINNVETEKSENDIPFLSFWKKEEIIYIHFTHNQITYYLQMDQKTSDLFTSYFNDSHSVIEYFKNLESF